MRVFLVEDEPTIVEAFHEFCAHVGIELMVSSNHTDAMNAIAARGYGVDLAICDLKIPSVAGAVDEDVSFGINVVNRLIKDWPSVPVIVLSAFGTLDVVAGMLLDARQVDIYGTGVDLPMLRFQRKAHVADVLDLVRDAHVQLEELAQLELAAPHLDSMYRQSLRIFARRRGGRLIEYRSLSGGLSGAQTGLATVRGSQGEVVAHAVAKMTKFQRALEEKERYRTHIAGRLGAGSYADLSDEVLAGCGDSAALFHSVAGSFDREFFAVLQDSDALAAQVVGLLREATKTWVTGVPHSTVTWADVRRSLISDDGYAAVRRDFDIIETADSKAIQVRWASQHGDLHGANVLVDASARPVLIDYGRTGPAPLTVDPLTLELSPLFHASSPVQDSAWPSISRLGEWDNLTDYLRDCPFPEFVRATRAWTKSVRAGGREEYSTLNALALRNLQYPDVDHDRALALQRFAATRLNEL